MDQEVVAKQDILLGEEEGKLLTYVKRLQGKVMEAYGTAYAKIGEDRTGCERILSYCTNCRNHSV